MWKRERKILGGPQADKHLSGTGRADPAFGNRLGTLSRSYPLLSSLIPRANVTERGKSCPTSSWQRGEASPHPHICTQTAVGRCGTSQPAVIRRTVIIKKMYHQQERSYAAQLYCRVLIKLKQTVKSLLLTLNQRDMRDTTILAVHLLLCTL